MKSNISTRRINLGRLVLVVDPHRKPDTPDPDESGPPCPECASLETFWFTDPRTTAPVLVCFACIRETPEAQDAPEAA